MGAASLLWTSSISQSLMQWLMDLETLVFTFFYMKMFLHYKVNDTTNELKVGKLLSGAVFVVAIGFFCGMMIDPDHYYRLTHGGEVSRLGGFIINPNELGMLLVVGIAGFFTELRKEDKIRISILLKVAFLTYLLMLTGSRSSFIGFLLVSGIYAFLQPSKLFKGILLFAMAVVIPIIGIQLFVTQSNAEEIGSLTGRLPFWKDLLTYNFPKEPWFGFGYMRIDYSDKFESINAYAGAMTHNTFLQVLLGLGMVGLLIVFLQLASFIYALVSSKSSAAKIAGVLILIPLIINSLTEFGIFGETNYGILFYLILNFSFTLEPKACNYRTIRSTNHYESESDILNRSIVTA
jgi:O-antigen ligase